MKNLDFGRTFCSTVAILVFATSAWAQFGGFAEPVLFPVGDAPQSVAVGDLDGDGDLDLAVAIDTVETFDDVAVLLNSGDGTFAPPTLFSVGTVPKSLEMGDMDGDGDLDVAVVNQGSGDVSILLNNGNGTFAPEVFYATGDGPQDVALGDLDGDGDLDVATANDGSDDISVLLNNGNGTLAPRTTFAVGPGPASLAMGDLDGDNDLDLAVGISSGNDRVSILKNFGNGTFAAPVDFSVGNFPWFESVALGDLDDDGDLDVVVANALELSVSVLLGNGDGTYADAVSFSTAGANASGLPLSIKMGDMDGDGDLDLVMAEGPPIFAPSDSIAVLQNNGEGLFAPGINFPAGNTPLSLAIGDLDGDGDLDAVTANLLGDDVAVLLNLSNPASGIPPVARIDSPSPFECVCDVFQVTGVADVPGGDFERCTIEYKLASGGPWTLIGTFTSPVPEPGDTLVLWNTSVFPEGFYFLRLTVENGSGLDTSDTVLVRISGAFNPVAYTVPALSGGLVCPDGTVADFSCGPNSYTVEFAPAGSGNFQTIDPDNPVYDGNRINERLTTWDSASVPDGDYTLRATGTNACGDQASQTRDITIDNTSPDANVATPLDCACLEGVVEIRGTASDAHLRNWILQYTGGDADGWVTIDSGDTPVIDNLLGVWDTSGLLPCAYTVRLRAYDRAIVNCNSAIVHISEFTVSVDVGLCDVNFDDDNDGDVDLIDFSAFQDEFTGPLP